MCADLEARTTAALESGATNPLFTDKLLFIDPARKQWHRIPIHFRKKRGNGWGTLTVFIAGSIGGSLSVKSVSVNPAFTGDSLSPFTRTSTLALTLCPANPCA